MSAEAYVPSLSMMRKAWKAFAPDVADEGRDDEEFDRFVAGVKAAAWDEGFNSSENNIMDTPNPYRENGYNND